MRIFSFLGDGAAEAEARLCEIERRTQGRDEDVECAARMVLDDVRARGAAALREHAARLDGLSEKAPLHVTGAEMQVAWERLSSEQQDALELAANRIRAFAEQQMPREWMRKDNAGMTLGVMQRPLDSVACYVPAGRHPLPSTLLMTAIPAQVAGVPRIVVLSPRPSDMILAAAHLLGIREFLRVGGGHGVAAIAYGVEGIDRVDKICGPGSAYVTAAKEMLAADPSCRCTIDMAAGPTETVVASEVGSAAAIAADLVAQAEHDPAATVVFVTTKRVLAAAVRQAASAQSQGNDVARKALATNGAIFLAKDCTHRAEIVNRVAPEHLTVDEEADLQWVRHAGSVFVGTATPQPLGDYISGPNHTLPTAGRARWRGGLSPADFTRSITVQSASSAALRALAPQAVLLAEAEGLTGHANALRQALAGAEAGVA